MPKLILFGGGDAGGLLIGPHGVTPVPPFDPALRLQLRSIGTLVRAQEQIPDTNVRRQLSAAVTTLTNLAVSQVENVIGDIDDADGIVFQSDDGGFTCGSTGRPPIPIPWPPVNAPSLQRLITGGAISREAAEFLRTAAGNQANLIQLFRDPQTEAARVGLPLSPDIGVQLQTLNIGHPERIEDPIDREIVEFFHIAVADGRFVDQWAAHPSDVAERLGVKLSQAANDRIVAVSHSHLGIRQPGEVMSPAAVAVVVVIVVVLWSNERKLPVTDLSGLDKF